MGRGGGGLRSMAGARGKAGREEGGTGGGRLSRRASDPAAEAERRAAQDKMYSLDIDKVLNGKQLVEVSRYYGGD